MVALEGGVRDELAAHWFRAPEETANGNGLRRPSRWEKRMVLRRLTAVAPTRQEGTTDTASLFLGETSFSWDALTDDAATAAIGVHKGRFARMAHCPRGGFRQTSSVSRR